VLALGVTWSDDRLIAVHEDGTPVRHEWYSDEFQRLRERAGLRRIHLKGLRNTSVSLMRTSGAPVHIVAGWAVTRFRSTADRPGSVRTTAQRPGLLRRAHGTRTYHSL
jgi:hypothetical protein